MKKILIYLTFFFLFITWSYVFAWGCEYSWDIKWALDWCLSDTTLVNPNWDAKLESWVVIIINKITKTVATVLSLFAVWWIVYGSFVMVTAAWEDEKIKKAKDIIKWSIFWFLWVVLASSIIALVVNFIYSLW